MTEKYRFKIKGNESFTIREGWLRKVLRHVPNEKFDNVFRRDDATELFGVGSNMVKAIRYWSNSTGLVEEDKSGKRDHAKTEIGQLVDKYDPYFDDLFSLWLVHYNLAVNEEEATIWYYFFNEFSAKTFTKDALFRELHSVFCTKTDERPSEKSFWDDCAGVIKTYCSEEKNQNPEENYICPLAELGLVNHIEKDRYEKTMPSTQKLDKLAVLYAVIRQIESREKNSNGSISLEDALYLPGSPGKVFNLNRYRLFEYFESLRNTGYVTINRTAGLNMIYVQKEICSKDVIEKYYELKK